MYNLKICHLYPDILNLYGDSGNLRCMQKRLQWRGIEAELTGISVGQDLDYDAYDVFVIGGGQDFEQEVLIQDLLSTKGQAIKQAVEEEKTFLAICAGYQILGNYYKTWDGKEYEFIGALDLYSVGTKKRVIGDYMFQCDEADGGMTVVGFENHSGQTYLGDHVRPFGKVLAGSGNNGKDKTEGARYKNVFASYSHGPVLPKNPKLCDHILKTALKRKYSDISLEELDDLFEYNAHDFMEHRLNKGTGKTI
ncbi:MAG: glutamine amidotransferase [Lachnospiraceae bacterium]